MGDRRRRRPIAVGGRGARGVARRRPHHYDEPLHCRAGSIYLEGRGTAPGDGLLDPLAGVSSVANAAWMRIRGFPPVRGPEPVSRAALLAAREVNHVAGALVVLALAILAGRWWGPWAAAITAVAAAASPTLLAHAAIVSPDLHTALLSLLGAVLLYRWLREPRVVTAASFGILIGLGAAVKLFTLVLPATGLVLLATRRRWWPDAAPRPAARWWRGIAVGFGAAVLTGWSVHAWTGLGDPTVWCGASFDHWRDMFVAAESKQKTRTFFAGDVERSHYLFVPAMIALKVPLALLCAAVLAFVLRSGRSAGRRAPRGFVFGAWVALAYVTAVWVARSQLGIRHALPALLMLPLVLASLWPLVAKRGPWWRGALAAGLAWLVTGTARVMPFPLCYGNELAGGPNGVHRWFVDSQLDWGQAFLALRRWIDEHPEAGPLRLAYFGSCRPSRFGIESEILPSPLTPSFGKPPEETALPDDVRGWIAISETTLKGTYARQCGMATDYYAALEGLPVVARVGYAIRIVRR